MKKTTFINKYADSGNVAQSTHEERRLINERNREHRKPQQSKKKALKKQQHHLHSAKRCNHSAQGHKTGKPLITESLPGDGRSIPLAKDGLAVFSNRTLHFSPRSQSVALQMSHNPGNPVDPFNASTISPNDTIIQLLRYYKQIYHHTIWDQVRLAFDGDISIYSVTRCPAEEIILECMQNRARIYTLLANLACQIRHLHNSLSHPEIEDLIQKAIHAFREEFRSNARMDGGMLCNALHLYLAVSAIDQTEAAKAHLKGLLAIMERIVEQGDRIIKPQAALVAIVDPGLSRRLLMDPTRVCERPPKMLGAVDVKYLKSKGYPVSNGRELVV